MTREEALAWTARWREVGEVTDREARDQSPAARFVVLRRLRDFAAAAPLRNDPASEAGVWDRFQTLRMRLGCGARRES